MDSSPADFLNGDPHNWSAEAVVCQLVSPLEVFTEWFGQLPVDVQDTVAGEICTVLNMDALYQQTSGGSTDWLVNLTTWLWSVPARPEEILPRFLLLRAAMDLKGFAHRASADDWLLHEEEMALLDAKWAEHLPANVVALGSAQAAAQAAVRARQWIAAAASWRKLRASVLGDEALSTWHEIAGWQQG